MEENKIEENKMTYEQLNNIAHQLQEQNKSLYQQLQEANLLNMFKRMDYLFKVLENSNSFESWFVDKCVLEIQDIMIVPTESNLKE